MSKPLRPGSRRMYYDKLKENLFVDIDYPKEITALIGNAGPWRAFTQLPQEVKEHYRFPNHQQDSDPGYSIRSKAAGREDKEYFHAYPKMDAMIGADGFAEEVAGNPVLKDFFAYSTEVQAKAEEFALAIGREMGKEIPELAELIDGGKVRSVLRLLHYTNDEETDIIAAQHFDRSLYTLHLYESGPGLQFMDWDMNWKDAPIDIGKTVIFSGYRLEQLTAGKVQKTWHRVARKESVKDRISMVLFVWTKAVQDYDRTGRSQELTPSYTKI